ncbi:hypothetical protein ABIB25_001057 [Nakamurella sp. UYEF19]|uniref:hypothetical protein n=1 Tax=Nakamurella sp. UYEF19 TaxID=1756392 RepID=UPI0033927530
MTSFPFVPSGRFVAQYRDLSSGHLFVVARPADAPDLWTTYLDGAMASYAAHGVESVLEYESVVDGHSTALFFAAIDPAGRVAGGMRVQGRYSAADEAHALVEWAGRPGTEQLRGEIEVRLADGVIEMKTGWVDDHAPKRHDLTNGLARIFVHAMELMGVRHAMGTVAQHAVPRWRTTGGVVSPGVVAVAYPTPDYQTVLMWWDRETFADLAVPEQLPLIMSERAQLAGRSFAAASVAS